MNQRPDAPREHEDEDVQRAYRSLPGDEVPPEIDARVLQAARTAVAQRRKPTWVRWSAPVALAASVLVVVAVVLDPGARKKATVTDALETHRTAAPLQERSYGVDRADDVREDGAVQRPEAERPQRPSAPAPAAVEFDSQPPEERKPTTPKPVMIDMAPVESVPAPHIDMDAVGTAAQALSKEVEPEKKQERQEEQKAAASRAADSRARENALLREAPPSTAITTTTATRPVSPPPPAAVPVRHPPLDVWLRQIHDLRIRGDNEQANKEIEALRQAYPEIDVEKELATIRKQR
ncbi:MAG: hypothetical protein ABW110_15545 [Steroidobacteraceae bacterium]